MKRTFVKEFQGIGACDVYVSAVDAEKKNVGGCQFACELLDVVDEKRFSGKEGELFKADLIHEGKLVSCIFAGLGKESTPHSVEAAFACAVKEAKKQKPHTIGVFVNQAFPGKSVEAVLLADDGFDAHKSEKADEISYVFYGVEEAQAREGVVLGEAVRTTRRLVNEPSNVMTPAQLATEALLAGADSGFDVKVYGLPEIQDLGMKAFLEVARGSDREPKVIAMSYCGDPDSKKILGLVGKGLCYDSGGYSLKPSTGMETMHTDMGGAGAVIGAISAIAKMKLPINVTAVVAACENILSAHAYHPGDIIGSMAGKTIEINNTDAEGRVTLADAVTFAIQEQKVTHIIDVATLTGAAITALGHEITAVVSDSDELWEKTAEAAKPSCEKVWRLPVDKVLGKALDSKTADMRNSSGRAAGTICGGMFIQKFTQGLPWLHLDIAGTSYTDGTAVCPFGATGVGVRLLYHVAKNCAK
ncbi:MAG: leucyl aminopeptidase [Oscillospiraceae bacterium]|nr:leucyl aminopeptidase [Oscillospiraceae bacterium]